MENEEERHLIARAVARPAKHAPLASESAAAVHDRAAAVELDALDVAGTVPVDHVRADHLDQTAREAALRRRCVE